MDGRTVWELCPSPGVCVAFGDDAETQQEEAIEEILKLDMACGSKPGAPKGN